MFCCAGSIACGCRASKLAFTADSTTGVGTARPHALGCAQANLGTSRPHPGFAADRQTASERHWWCRFSTRRNPCRSASSTSRCNGSIRRARNKGSSPAFTGCWAFDVGCFPPSSAYNSDALSTSPPCRLPVGDTAGCQPALPERKASQASGGTVRVRPRPARRI